MSISPPRRLLLAQLFVALVQVALDALDHLVCFSLLVEVIGSPVERGRVLNAFLQVSLLVRIGEAVRAKGHVRGCLLGASGALPQGKLHALGGRLGRGGRFNLRLEDAQRGEVA